MVPFVMRRLEATNARKVVLFRVQSKEDWWSNNWKEREEEISLIPYHHEIHLCIFMSWSTFINDGNSS